MFNSINFSNSNEWESYPFPSSNEDSLNNSIISNNINLILQKTWHFFLILIIHPYLKKL